MKKTLFLLVIFVAAGVLWGQQKFALVIGNGSYTHFGSLKNAVNDADDVAAALQGLGFTVDKLVNGNLSQMESAAVRLKDRLTSAGNNAYGFFYYAGHGVQVDGINYLIPANANIPEKDFLPERAISAQTVLSLLNRSKNALNIVVLDACRDFPAAWHRSADRGLAVMHPPSDSIIMYATAAGRTASDGTGRNGLFTGHLLKHLKTPGIEVSDIFRNTMRDVADASKNEQRPAMYTDFARTAYLGTRPAAPVAVQPAANTPAQPAVQPTPQTTQAPATVTPAAPPQRPVADGFEYELNDGMSVTITKSIGNAATVNIPDRIQNLPVTSIGNSAFSACDRLTSITVDSKNSSFAVIDGVLFDNALRTIVAYPPGRTTGSYAIPSSVTSIGGGAFNSCKSLTKVTIPSSVTSIGERAFLNCKSLTSVTIPSSVTSIGNSAFSGCEKLKSVTIASSVTSIGKSAFSNCTSLTTVTIPSSVTSIEESAFFGCTSLKSVTIPSSVTSIGKSVFSGCDSLTGITVDSQNSSYASIDGVLFDYTIRTILAYPAGKKTETYAIPSSVTSIENSAFYRCNNLTKVTMPSSVTSIGNSAFSSCKSLTSVTISSSVRSIGSAAFHFCESLTYVTIPSSVTSIGESAFYGCKSLTGITISSSLTSIEKRAFSDCKSLTSVTIPSSVTSIGEWAFSSCESLTRVTIPSSVTSIGNSAFFGCKSLTSVTIPSSVTSIGNSVFAYCTSLTSVTLLSRETQVGKDAFPQKARITYQK